MQIKFITINIWNGGKLFDNLASFLRKENPDIIAMQEVYAGTNNAWERTYKSLSELQKILLYKHTAFAPQVLDKNKRGKIEVGNAIFSKFPIVSQENIFYDIPFKELDLEQVCDFRFAPSNLQKTSILINNINFYVFNNHGIWDYHGNDNERRLKMSQKIISEIKNKSNVILAGDFNVNYGTKTIKNIQNYLNNIFDGELKTSFNMKRKTDGGYATSAVDMIMVSKDIKVISHICPNVDISDHLPLIARFEI